MRTTAFDVENSTLFLDLSEVFHLKYSPFQPVRVRYNYDLLFVLRRR
jgi:hypothetical protein